jgi:hypothetical protein
LQPTTSEPPLQRLAVAESPTFVQLLWPGQLREIRSPLTV